MLTQMRNAAQSWIIKSFLALLALTFVVSFGIGTFSNPKEVVVEVDGEEILATEFLRVYQRELEQMRERVGEEADRLASSIGLRRLVLRRLVNRRLLLNEARRLGLETPDEVVRRQIASEAGFQREGRFDYELYRDLLSRSGLSPSSYEEGVREDLLLEIWRRMVSAGVIVDKEEVDRLLRMETEQVEVVLAPLRLNRFPAAPPAKEETLRSWHAAHADDFVRPRRLRIRYLSLALRDLLTQVEIPQRMVERYYERNRENYTKPARVRARHLLVRLTQEATPEATRVAEEKIARAKAALEAGTPFEKVAQQHSEDFSKERGGDLGFFTAKDMYPAFSTAAFALQPGQRSDTVRTPFGLHLIQVVAREKEQLRPLEELQEEILRQLQERRAEARLDATLNRMPARIRKEGWGELSALAGRPASESPWFDGKDVVEGIGVSAALYQELAAAQVGAIGVLRRNPLQGHVFYELLAEEPQEKLAFETVRKEVLKRWQAEQRMTQAHELAQAAAAQMKSEGDFRRFVRRYDLSWRSLRFSAVQGELPELGAKPWLQRAAFSIAPATQGIFITQGSEAYLLWVRQRILIQENADQPGYRAELQKWLLETLRGALVASETDRLREAAQIRLIAPGYVQASTPSPTQTPATGL